MRFFVIAIACGSLALASCVSATSQYTPPVTRIVAPNTEVIDRSPEEVWSNAIPKIGKTFFVINNLDKTSGLINVSYTGDPEKYLDCGEVNMDVDGPRGKQHFGFAGSVQRTTYLTATVIPGNIYGAKQLLSVDRGMSIDGRVNVVFEKVDDHRTRVTATTRYVVTRSLNSAQGNRNDTIALTTGGQTAFPALGPTGALVCKPTGTLEADLLALISQ